MPTPATMRDRRFVHQAALDAGAVFRNEPKFNGRVASARIGGQDVRLFVAAAYMNESGRAVAGVARFYKVPVEQILVAHDELDLPPGTVRLKKEAATAAITGCVM